MVTPVYQPEGRSIFVNTGIVPMGLGRMDKKRSLKYATYSSENRLLGSVTLESVLIRIVH